jgi:hypothetical protein
MELGEVERKKGSFKKGSPRPSLWSGVVVVKSIYMLEINEITGRRGNGEKKVIRVSPSEGGIESNCTFHGMISSSSPSRTRISTTSIS